MHSISIIANQKAEARVGISTQDRASAAEIFAADPGVFLLQFLPLELRRQIYRAYFRQAVHASKTEPNDYYDDYDLEREDEQIIDYCFGFDKAVNLNLLLTKKQVYHEAKVEMHKIVHLSGSLYEYVDPHKPDIEPIGILAIPGSTNKDVFFRDEVNDYEEELKKGSCLINIALSKLVEFRNIRIRILLAPPFPCRAHYNAIVLWGIDFFTACDIFNEAPNTMAQHVHIEFHDMTTASGRNAPLNTRLERWKHVSAVVETLTYAFHAERTLTLTTSITAAGEEQFMSLIPHQEDGTMVYIGTSGVSGDLHREIRQGIIESDDENSDADEVNEDYEYYDEEDDDMEDADPDGNADGDGDGNDLLVVLASQSQNYNIGAPNSITPGSVLHNIVNMPLPAMYWHPASSDYGPKLPSWKPQPPAQTPQPPAQLDNPFVLGYKAPLPPHPFSAEPKRNDVDEEMVDDA